MSVGPLHDGLIVRSIEVGEQTSGVISTPDTAKEQPQRGRVIAASFGKVNKDGKRSPLDVKTGNVIPFGKHTRQEVKLDGEDPPIMREDEVPAVPLPDLYAR